MKEITLKRFCGECGSPMKVKWGNTWFNRENGNQQGTLVWECPNNKGWFSSHDYYKSNESGSTYAYEI